MEKILTKQDFLDMLAAQAREQDLRFQKFENYYESLILKEIESRKREKQEREEREKEKEKKREAEEKKRFKEYDDRMRKLEGNWGRFVESLVRPGLIDIFEPHGIYLKDIYPNVFGYKDNQRFYEIDLFAIDDIYAVAVEIKTTLKISDIDDHLERMAKIQAYPPRNFALQGKSILGAVAGITIQDNVDKYAQKNGLYLMTQKGNLLDMINPVHPQEWKIE